MLRCPDSWARVRARDPEGLTPRERQCVRLERVGFKRTTIASTLGLSVRTVAVHLWKADLRGAKLRRPIKVARKRAIKGDNDQ